MPTPRHTRRLLTHAFAFAAVVMCFGAAQAAQEAGIAVVGRGTAEARPTAVTIVSRVTAEAPLAADAVVKFRDAKRRAIEAMEGAGIDGLSIEGGGFSIDSTITQQQMQMIWQGQPQPQLDTQVRVSELLTITLAGVGELDETALIEHIMKTLDVAKDAGLVTGAAMSHQGQPFMWGQQMDTSLATFTIDNPDATKASAYESAVADARAQAQRLADLAGVKLGPIVAIEETAAGTGGPQISAMYFYNYAQQQQQTPESTTRRFGPLPITVNLRVRFAIQQD